jgi:hypothetical protein
VERSHIRALTVGKHLLRKLAFCNMSVFTLVKNHSHVWNVESVLHKLQALTNMYECIVEKSPILAIFVVSPTLNMLE